MKILCDVCDIGEATVFCIADEAALCAACDHSVHHANKLAGKHRRFSLSRPSAQQAPLCDICKGKKAFLFCQEDRAILCRDCDFQIHKANELTRKHARFLLTGVQLSPEAALYSEPPPQPAKRAAASELDPVTVPKRATPNPKGATPPISTLSSVSEYFIETLPGWRVDDFLDSPNQIFEVGEQDLLSLRDSDLYVNSGVFTAENSGLWAPQVVAPAHQSQTQSLEALVTSGFKGNSSIKSNRKQREDNSFAVPEISLPSRRTFW